MSYPLHTKNQKINLYESDEEYLDEYEDKINETASKLKRSLSIDLKIENKKTKTKLLTLRNTRRMP